MTLDGKETRIMSMGVKGKFVSVCAALSAFTVVVGVIGLVSLRSVAAKYDIIASFNMPNIKAMGEMLADQRRFRIDVTKLAIDGLSAEQISSTITDAEKYAQDYMEADKAYNDVPFAPGEEEIYKPVNASWKVQYQHGQNIFEMAKNPKEHAKLVSIVLGDFEKESSSYGGLIGKLIDFHVSWAKRSVAEAKSASTIGSTLSSVLVIVGFAASLIVGVFFASSLAKVLSQIANTLSAGAEDVASASTEVSTASASLSSSATEQAAAIQETASSIEEISATIKKNADNSKRSASLSEQSQSVAVEGKEIVQGVIETISDISRSNDEVTQQMEASNREFAEIVKVISDIGNKTKVINDIVFQTKLLSFNASVEAARAGEHGKGFAVVAEEVGNLAQMSGNAAREITSMLDESIQRVERIVNDTKSKIEILVTQSRDKIQKGTTVANKCGESLSNLVENVSSVNQMIGEIAQASQEQANGVSEINNAISQLDQVTQQNASASQQSASAANQLSSQAESLRTSVSMLLALVNGNASSQSFRVADKAPAVSKRTVAPPKAPRSSKKETGNVVQLKQPVAPSAARTVPDESDQRFKAV
jgi:methyl-accepting chemotaxis protein